jgi:hypothetical protein
VHVPAPSHVSLEHGLPSSLHAVPLALFTIVQPPTPSHVALSWQSVAVHEYAVPPQVPAVQTSLFVHALPSSHTVPSATLLHAVVELAGVHTKHAFAGFTAPAA